MALFGSKNKSQTGAKAPVFTKPIDPGWVHTKEGGFFNFLDIDPELLNLSGAKGVFLIWHAGVHPEWVYVEETDDLAEALHSAGRNKDITQFEANGGLFVSWAPIRPEYRKGVVRYIEENFKTLVKSASQYTDNTQLVPVTSPTTTPKC